MATKPEIKYASTRAKLLATIESFLAANPTLEPTEFGWYAIKDSSLVERLRKGGDVTTAKLDAILLYLSKIKPKPKQ